jgi:hypothetical protein
MLVLVLLLSVVVILGVCYSIHVVKIENLRTKIKQAEDQIADLRSTVTSLRKKAGAGIGEVKRYVVKAEGIVADEAKEVEDFITNKL